MDTLDPMVTFILYPYMRLEHFKDKTEVRNLFIKRIETIFLNLVKLKQFKKEALKGKKKELIDSLRIQLDSYLDYKGDLLSKRFTSNFVCAKDF